MNKPIGISLGWNYHSAGYGVQVGLRERKGVGYKTCPFDEMITNLKGVEECLADDFKYFMDEKYLQVLQAPFSIGGIVEGEYLVYNTKYNFIFNHESPGHANLYVSQGWTGGIDHYIKDDFLLLKERYNRRVDSFRKYTQQGDEVTFVVTRFNKDVSSLQASIQRTHPALDFKILTIDSPDSKEVVHRHYLLMGMKEEDIQIELLEQ
jgi:hypothetical protein